jgi:type II secretory pathway pseudopilin PulG
MPGVRGHLLSHARGASLIESIIAVAIVVTVTAGVAHLLVWARRSVWLAGERSTAARAAAQKIEQLRALPWFTDADGIAVSDDTANLSTDPPQPTGTGLQRSPDGALDANLAGFVDYVGVDGLWCGNGPRPPPCAVFVRRWAIQPLVADPADSIVITVVVLRVTDASSGDAARRAMRLSSIRTRSSG